MQKPHDALEQEFNKNGVFFHAEKSISQFEGQYLSVEVDIAIPDGVKPECPDFSMSVVNRRGVATLITDWKLREEDGQHRLSFCASIRTPAGFEVSNVRPELGASPLAMTFLDLCFYAGNEAIPEGHQVDTFTKQRPNTTLVDLGWFLPSRFVDALIDALGKLNDTVLAGILEEAILYGPRVKR